MNTLFQMSGSPEAGSLDLIQWLYSVLGYPNAVYGSVVPVFWLNI